MTTDIAMHIMMTDVFVSSIQFSEDQVQITYLENRNQQIDSAVMSTMMVQLQANERWRAAYVALQESLVDFVDDVLVHMRTEGKAARTAEIKTPQERMAQAKLEAEMKAQIEEQRAEIVKREAKEKEERLRAVLGNALGEVPT